jgi:hypothetical protein
MLGALREREIASLLRHCSNRCPGRERVANYSLSMRLSILLGKARRHPPVLGAMVKRRAQPDAGMSLAGLGNSRCD